MVAHTPGELGERGARLRFSLGVRHQQHDRFVAGLTSEGMAERGELALRGG